MGIFDNADDILSGVFSDIFGGAGNTATGSTGVGGYSQPGYSVPSVAYQQPQYQNVMAMAPAVQGVARWAMSFPSLWQALQHIRANYRVPMTVDKLWRLVKSAGPQMVVGLIGAAALNELFVYHSTHKRRRMNVANTHALRRSVRRLKGFEKLSHRVSAQLGRMGGRRRTSSRRCGTCRKSPCSC